MSEITVGQNRPRLLQPDAAAPPPDETMSGIGLGPEPEPSGPYWTADKAARVFAECGKALAKLYGPDFRMSSVELDLVGQPAANVLNDHVTLPSGPGGDKLANLLALGGVLALLGALRLPGILEAHDLLPSWAYARRQRQQPRRAAPSEGVQREADSSLSEAAAAPSAAPFAAPAPEPAPAAPAGSWSPDKWKKFGATTVGGGDDFARTA